MCNWTSQLHLKELVTAFCYIKHSVYSRWNSSCPPSITVKLLSDRRQRVRLDGKVSASVDVVLGVPQTSVLEQLLFKLYTSEVFHTDKNHIVSYADDATIYIVIAIPLSRPQGVEWLKGHFMK